MWKVNAEKKREELKTTFGVREDVPFVVVTPTIPLFASTH